MKILIDGQTLETPEINRGIGVYFKNTLNNMVKQSYIHKWYITVSNKDSIKSLDEWVQGRLIPIENNIFVPSTDYTRTENFTQELEKVVSGFSIDIYWNPNPLMVNVLFPNRLLKCSMFSMIHDIIPFIMPVKEWSKSVKNEYQRRLEYLKSIEMNLLCNSKATKLDFENYICKREGLYVTELAADSKKFYVKNLRQGINKNPNIIFTGGFDYRKNIDGAIRAFAKVNKLYSDDKVVNSAKMYIICSASNEDKERFYDMLKELGIEGKIELTGYISDEKLVELYSNCDLFFFPSLYEGFGLPIIEAMLAGSYTLSADNSSLPEVCGNHALLCNASNIEDMAEKIKVALHNAKNESIENKYERQKHALSFSWEKTASKTLDLFEKVNNKNISKKKIAIVTPWPKQHTGIANFIYKLIPYLIKYFDIDIFVDNTVVSNENLLKYDYGKLYLINQLESHYKEYDEIIYQIGNSSEFHTGIYKALLKYKGIAEIHDFILHPFFYHSYCLKKQYSIYREALVNGYGKAGEEHYNNVRENGLGPNNEAFPMSHSIVNISKAVIFHNHWSSDQINRRNVFTIPHPCFDKESLDNNLKNTILDKIKKKIEYKNEFLIGCFGFINENKRPIQLIAAVEALLKQNYNIKLVFFGQVNYKEIKSYIDINKLDNNIFITGYLEQGEYEVGLEFVDLVVNLRYPSMGESSGTLSEAFKYGKPVIVSDLNQYKEYPNEICWKVPVENMEIECLIEMISYLINNNDVRKALGENAKNYADNVLLPEKIAEMYYYIIENFNNLEENE